MSVKDLNVSSNTDYKNENLRNLYGLTLEVEKEIVNSIITNSRTRLISLFQLLHPADQADMLERLDKIKLEDLV